MQSHVCLARDILRQNDKLQVLCHVAVLFDQTLKILVENNFIVKPVCGRITQFWTRGSITHVFVSTNNKNEGGRITQIREEAVLGGGRITQVSLYSKLILFMQLFS